METTARTELKILRIRNGLTQKEVAERLGVSCATYNLIEQGKRRGSTELWLNIQRLFRLGDDDVWQIYANK